MSAVLKYIIPKLIKDRLRQSVRQTLHPDTVREVLEAFDSLERLTDSLLVLNQQEGNWRIPLSDGVRAEVTIYGSATAEHVRAFAAIFQHIADCYVAPVNEQEAKAVPA